MGINKRTIEKADTSNFQADDKGSTVQFWIKVYITKHVTKIIFSSFEIVVEALSGKSLPFDKIKPITIKANKKQHLIKNRVKEPHG